LESSWLTNHRASQKSLYDETSVEIRPLTLLAGANSSGKSSLMQPLLLMKQTLESEYEPEVFRLHGTNVKFTSPKQFFSLFDKSLPFTINIEINGDSNLNLQYSNPVGEGLQIDETSYQSETRDKRYRTKNGKYIQGIHLKHDMEHDEIHQQIPVEMDNLRQTLEKMTPTGNIQWKAKPNRCFLDIGMIFADGSFAMEGDPLPLAFFPLYQFSNAIQEIIHVPGLRDNPQRNYPVASVAGNFGGTFDNYFASVIAHSSINDEETIVERLIDPMLTLGLSSGIGASIRNNQIEISVDHALGSADEINIADVGLGISQVLPVLVALLVAKSGQLVYLEQPELHLHPRAQVKLAEIIAEAAKRGVRVVVETHSSLLLLGIQTLIAENKLNHEDVILHWFKRGEDGKTTVTSVEPDENGAYGEWPEDFADVELKAQMDYLDAVATREAVE
jgi:predicted ATPase